MDSVKVTGMYEWPTLENKNDIQAFLGFINFYRCFIQNFLTIVCPLFDLIRANQAQIWMDKKCKAFNTLKQAVTSALVLVSLQDLDLFRIGANSSNFATRVVLSQQLSNNGGWCPVVFYSKSLSPVEQNYKIHNKKILAIIQALKE